MSAVVESDQTSSGVIEESPLHWDKSVPEELREEASFVSKLAFDLFQKLERDPNVYVPFDMNCIKDRCRFFWTNNRGQFGSITLNRNITTENENNKELPEILLRIFHEKTVSKSPFVVSSAIFTEEKKESEWTAMPVELRREAENLIKASALFFRKIVRYPDVITIDNGDKLSNPQRVQCYDKKGRLDCSIAFSEEINRDDRLQQLN
ncbi:MAG: hypothetical protein AAGE99_03250, partial [Chlamydiota bacterium]